VIQAMIIVSAAGQKNVRQKNGGIFSVSDFLSGWHGAAETIDQSP
jgi:hypothetical protein